MVNMAAEAEKARRIFGPVREAFMKRIPAGTDVWADHSRRDFGTTVGGTRIYTDIDNYVMVNNVNGVNGTTGLWTIKNVIKK